MDMNTFLESLQNTLGSNLPSILGAIAILILGWFVAILVRAGIRRSLSFLKLNSRVQAATGSELDIEGGIAKGGYYIILLLALIAFFNALDLFLVSGPLQSLVDQVFAYAPRLAAGGLLILVAWILAMILRKLVTKGLAATKLDEKLSKEAGMRPISDSLGNVLYWLVILLFLPGILGALGLQGLLMPIQGMVDKTLALIPNVFAAVLIGLVGWFVARLLRDLVSNLLAATGADALGQKAGLRATMSLSKLVGVVVYIFVLVPALIAALDALKIESISRPASDMLGSFMAAIPNVFAATLILGVAYFVARFVAEVVSNLLEGVGFNELPALLGIKLATSESMSPAKLVGKLIIFFGMIFATVEAASRLAFTQVSELVATFIEFGGQVLLGIVIMAVGLWISNLACDAIRKLNAANAAVLATLARYAILGLVLAMGLRAMGIADDIVNLAFALTLGAVAVAVALSFGLGGREAAGKQMEHWLSRFRGEG
jgi:hypothetical protein